MTEKQLIAKIKKLRQIKPRQDWVVLTKRQILGEEKTAPTFSFISFLKELHRGERFIFQHKPAFASLLVFMILIGLFGFGQNSLPGDSLYSIKKITEKSQGVFISGRNQLKHDLGLANKRLDDLTRVVETNSAKNLGPAINEFQASVSKVAESLTKAETEKNPQIMKEIALEVKKIEEKTKRIKSLGIEIGENKELDNALSQIIEEQIQDLENRVLTEEEQEILDQVKESYEDGNYLEALEEILLLGQ